MQTSAERCLDTVTLTRILQATDPAVLLVPPRILRRVIKRDSGLRVLGLQVPHFKSYVISRSALLRLVDLAELGLGPEAVLPETLIVLEQPDPAKLQAASPAEALAKYWRRLFHARVHIALENRFSEAGVTRAGIRQRIHRLGQTEFNEVRNVLSQEKYLLPPRDEHSTYVEFAAVYLELRHFAPPLLAYYFPNLTHLEDVDALLAEDVDAAALLARTRPAGAPDLPGQSGEVASYCPRAEETRRPDSSEPALPETHPDYHYWLDKATKAASVGNVVRAAILKKGVGLRDPAAAEGMGLASAELDQLTRRLKAALELSDTEAAQWRRGLAALLVPATYGFRAVEARLLYDLQKVCIDHERGIYAVDLVEWVVSLGKHPIKRELPGQKDVLAVKRLRRAGRRLGSARIGEEERRRLDDLIESAIAHSAERLRLRFRPLIAACFDKVGLVPHNLPEAVARDKVVEEMLDEIVERGFATMGDLRDTLSRNQLKLPDVSAPAAVVPGGSLLRRLGGRLLNGLRTTREFLVGDKLIRLNRELALSLDGVYHRGEVYLRMLQRLSSLAFGTPAGRFLTRYFVLPFGGAFILMKFFHYMFEEFGLHVEVELPTPPSVEAKVEEWLRDLGLHEPDAGKIWTVFVVGSFLMLLLYAPRFRGVVGRGFHLVAAALRRVCVDLPAWVLHLPPVRAVLDSRPVAFFRRFLLQPVLCTAGAVGLGALLRLRFFDMRLLTGVTFVGSLVLCNTRLGRDLDEMATDLLVRGWRRLSIDIIPGIFRFIIEVFRQFLEVVQRLLYRIDEWLRFRRGESRLSLAVKAVAGVVWFFVTYVIRFAINVLIEPQINPIKHFPVVTVSHKLVWTLALALAKPVAETMGWTVAYAAGILSTIAWMIPGVFGFMAWELKENWFLYRANRSARLKPVMVGHHGETMLRLLKHGFHSGTVPRLHAKLRRAARKGYISSVHKQREALHHVGASVRHFVERELVDLLHKSKCWADSSLRVGAVVLGSNRIRVELPCPALSKTPLWLSFDEEDGWLLAGVAEPGWLTELSQARRAALALALAGLYKWAGVALVREQIAACLPPSCHDYDLRRDGLIVWPDAACETEAVYPLNGEDVLQPQLTGDCGCSTLPALDRTQVLFGDTPITWQSWVEAWERDQAGKELPEQLLPGVRLL